MLRKSEIRLITKTNPAFMLKPSSSKICLNESSQVKLVVVKQQLRTSRKTLMRMGRKFPFSDENFFNLMALMIFSGFGMTKISHQRPSQRDTVEEGQSWYRGELWSCKLCRGVETQHLRNDHRYIKFTVENIEEIDF